MTRVVLEQGPDAGQTWHFGDPLAEQRAMMAGEAVVELGSREVFTVRGADRLTWLHALTSQALAGLPAGGTAEALVLSPTGRIDHGFSVIDDGATCWCWTEPGDRAGLVEWLVKMRFWAEVTIEARDDLRLVWLGEQVTIPDARVAERPAALGRGREVLLPAGASWPAGRPAGQWAHEALRIAAGIPRIGLDTDERALPNEIGLFGTALGKGCYPGQETVARVHNLGRPPRRLVRLLFDGDLPAPGAGILAGGRQAGVVGTLAQHHELGPIGLAPIRRSVPVGQTLLVAGLAAAQEALVDPEIGEHFRPGW